MYRNEIREILSNYKVIAVVGLSTDEEKPSHEVATYLKEHGYRIIPVNPIADAVLGEKSYKSLLDVPNEIQGTIEIVDIFRRSEFVMPIVEQTIKLKEKWGKPFVVWMQLGIVDDKAAELAREAGLMVIMDKCLKIEYQRLFDDR